MARSFPNLLSPIGIGHVTLRNRVLVTAHVPGIEQEGLVSDAYIAYQRARARGGAGLQISGSTQVHRTGSVGAGRSLNNTKPEIIGGYRRLADAVHAEGGRFLIQLGHSAATVNDQAPGRPLIAPSPVPSQIIKETPQRMTGAMIAEVVEAYAASAGRVQDGGLDGVEILAAFGQLPAAFLSPLTNRRDDQFGGPLENRLRFLREVIVAIRERVGASFIVGVRLPGSEHVDGGLTRDEMEVVAEMLEADGGIDYLNVAVGTNYDRIMRMEHWPPTPAPAGLYVPLAAALKARVTLPVFTTGRITDPALAEDILCRGDADMVGMTRAHIADPDLVSKLLEDRAEDIRPCVGANLCISNATEGKPIRCIHNPEAAREHELAEAVPAMKPKRVAVIGGGPAGLEAARVAAERGHRVDLYEAGEELGGQFRRWALAPLTREYSRSLDWFERQLTRLQVAVHRSCTVDPDMLAGLEADEIILATGSIPLGDEMIEGAAGSPVALVSPWELMDRAAEEEHVVLVDEGGGRGGLSAVDAVLDVNRVTIVSTDFSIGELVNPNIRTPLYKRFLSRGAVFRPAEALVRLEGRCVVTRNIYSGQESRIEDVDVLVNWRGNRVCNDLEAALDANGLRYKLIGDCLAPRHLHTAIAEGALAAREL
ncbi:MAG: FAD-dependent oxidoreductase [Pseudomonadota bacterium]